MPAQVEVFIEPIPISTLTGLACAGDTVSRQGTLDVPVIHNSGHTFELSEGLSYDVALTNTGEGVLATGIVRGTAMASCDRCLEPASVDIAGEVSCYYLYEERDAQDDEDDEDEEDFGVITPDGEIDLAPAVQSAVLMDLPYVVLCCQDCKGLCPDCGCNLNEQTCDCASKRHINDPTNPFAALAGLAVQGEGGDSQG